MRREWRNMHRIGFILMAHETSRKSYQVLHLRHNDRQKNRRIPVLIRGCKMLLR
jgi:hypothetical protein